MTKEECYLELLLKKCISLKHSNSALISYSSYNEDFVQKLISKLKAKGIDDIYLECINPFEEHDYLKNHTLKEIEDSQRFDRSYYNEYAEKGAAFIMFASPVPGILNDIEDEKLALISKIKANSRKVFVEKETNYVISWTIVPLYNEYWEKDLGLNNLEEVLYEVCNVDENYEQNWQNFIDKSLAISKKIDDLELDYLEYHNSKGTDLRVGLPKDYHFESVGETEVLVNLPSYEIFTSPHRLKVNGTVYSARPLFYQDTLIDDFYLTFKDGKVIDFDAKKGKKALESIIDFDENSCYLGEVALVEKDSPISKTNIIFKTTLLDENASCHLALGRGFGKGTKEELLAKGINQSDIHVDFMVGTDDLDIVGYHGDKAYQIMKAGKFVI